MRRLVLFTALSIATSAFGEHQKAWELARDADSLYRADKYKEAADTLRKAYDAHPIGLYLYNIARAYEQAGELELSSEYYRKYLALPSNEATPELVKKANLAMERIAPLLTRSSADKQERDERQRLDDEAREAEARADAEVAEARRQRQAFAEKEMLRKEAENKRLKLRKLAAYGTGGAAVLGLGMALGFGIGSNANREAFRTADTLPLKQQHEAATRTTAAVADVSLLIGLAAGVAAVILYPKGDEQGGAVNVVFAPISGGGVGSVGVTF